MKFIIFDDCGTDVFTSEFETKEGAITQAENDWNKLSKFDKDRRKAFFVLESVNPDEEAENHYDGTPIKTWK